MTTLPLLLSGAVLACGALLVLSGSAKLYRAARRPTTNTGTGTGTIDDSAIRIALRINPRGWRRIETAAGALEAATGIALCTAFHPVVAGSTLGLLGAIFSTLLIYARRAKAPGGCSCVRRSQNPDAAIAWPVQARAAWLLAAGVIEALMRLPRPAATSKDGIIVGLAALSTLTLMLAAEGPWHFATCRLRVRIGTPFGPRATLRALMSHGVYESMATAVGPFAEGFAYRRDGCVEEFRFAATPRPGRADRTVTFRVTRSAARGAGLAVEAQIEAAAQTG